MQMKPLQSSNVAAIGYDPEARVFRVHFKPGKAAPVTVYDYLDVPPDHADRVVWEVEAAALAGMSQGGVVGKMIVRGGFKYVKVTAAEETAA